MSACMAGSSCVMFLFGTQRSVSVAKLVGNCEELNGMTDRLAIRQTSMNVCVCARERKSDYKLFSFL